MLAELRGALCRLAADRELRVLVLAGAGKHFSAGADVAEPLPPGHRDMSPEFVETIDAVAMFPVATSAAGPGRGLGGGFGAGQAGGGRGGGAGGVGASARPGAGRAGGRPPGRWWLVTPPPLPPALAAAAAPPAVTPQSQVMITPAPAARAAATPAGPRP